MRVRRGCGPDPTGSGRGLSALCQLKARALSGSTALSTDASTVLGCRAGNGVSKAIHLLSVLLSAGLGVSAAAAGRPLIGSSVGSHRGYF